MLFNEFLASLGKTYKTEKELVSIMRIFNTRSMILFYLIGSKISGVLKFSPDLIKVFLVFIIVYANASIINFIEDKNIDFQNKRYNPLYKQKFDKKIYVMVAKITAVFSIILSLTTVNKIINTIGAVILLILGYLYSKPPVKLSFHPLGKLLSMGLTYAYIPVSMGIFSGRITLGEVIFIFLLCSLYVSWMPYSDIKDIIGDKAHGKNTLAVTFGIKKLSFYCFIFSAVIILLMIPYVFTLLQKPLLITGLLISLLLLQAYAVFYPVTIFKKKVQIFGGYLMLFLLLLLVFL